MFHTTERDINKKQFPSSSSKTLSNTNKNDGNRNNHKSLSRDLFAMNRSGANESMNEQAIGKSPLAVEYSHFTNELKTIPTPITFRRTSNHNDSTPLSTPVKNNSSFLTSTPSPFKQNSQQQYSHSRTSNLSRSQHQSTSLSDSSRSVDTSSTFLDSSIGMRQYSHEKSKDRRSSNRSNICLGDFLLPATTSKQQTQKQRKSFNSFECSPTAANTSNERDFPNFTPKGKVNRISVTPDEKLMATGGASTSRITTTTPNSIQKSNHLIKPKKRVVPTRIAFNSNEFNCPAFRSDNNILELPHEENTDSTHDILKSQKDIIRRVFQQEEKPTPETNLRTFLHENLCHTKMKSTIMKNAPPIDPNKITNKLMLDKFIDIYSIVLDLNLTTNILTEFSYLVNLINVDIDEYYERNPHMLPLNCNKINDQTNVIDSTESEIKERNEQYNERQQQQQQQRQPSKQITNVDDSNMVLNELMSTCAISNDDINISIDVNTTAASLLKNINNCVYFGLGVLQLQKNILRLLDITTIKVLLDNERLITLNTTIKDDLMTVCAHKMQLQNSLRTHNISTNAIAQKVMYQQDQDTQINFPSSREFAAFKKQRDTFFGILE